MEKKLISAVRERACIYDRSLKAYRTKEAKKEAWLAVSAEVGVKVQQCQARWRSLRDRFVRELYKMSISDSMEKKWRYMDSLTFLTDHIEPRRSSNFDGKIESEQQEDYLYSPPLCNSPQFVGVDVKQAQNEQSEEEEDPVSYKKSRISTESTTWANERMDSLLSVLSTIGDKRENIFERISNANIDFMRMLDNYLQRLPDIEAEKTKLEVLNLVFEKTIEYR